MEYPIPDRCAGCHLKVSNCPAMVWEALAGSNGLVCVAVPGRNCVFVMLDEANAKIKDLRHRSALFHSGPFPDGHQFSEDSVVIVRYRNEENGFWGWGLACSSHDMAGVQFLQLTEGGDIPAHWVMYYKAIGGT